MRGRPANYPPRGFVASSYVEGRVACPSRAGGTFHAEKREGGERVGGTSEGETVAADDDGAAEILSGMGNYGRGENKVRVERGGKL